MKLYFFLLAFLTSFGLTSQASQANILEFFFPDLKRTRPDPSQTLEAPFADQDQIKKSDTQDETADNAIPLDLPHRSPEQISNWLVDNMAGQLTFESKSNFQSDLDALKPMFTAHSWKQYNEFLESFNMKKIMNNGRYSIRSFINEPPLFLTKGEVEGSYRWLYQLSMVVTYMQQGENYKSNSTAPTSHNFVIKAQLGRHRGTDNDYGILVENWELVKHANVTEQN